MRDYLSKPQRQRCVKSTTVYIMTSVSNCMMYLITRGLNPNAGLPIPSQYWVLL